MPRACLSMPLTKKKDSTDRYTVIYSTQYTPLWPGSGRGPGHDVCEVSLEWDGPCSRRTGARRPEGPSYFFETN